MKLLFRAVATLIIVSTSLVAQLRVSGQATAEFFKSEDGMSQYTVDQGRATFAWRMDLFADAVITDRITFLSNFRMLQDQVLHIDLLAVRIADIASTGIFLQAGQIDIPFGSLGEQRFPAQNPFFDLPLMNEHVSALCESNYDLWTFSPEYAMRGDGVRILDQGLYDLGIKLYKDFGPFDVAVAVINGMVSATGTYAPGGLNANHGLGTVGRISATPFYGLTLGLSYGYGDFMKDVSDSPSSQLYDKSPDNYLQRIAGADIAFALEHFTLRGEVISNLWDYVQGVSLKTVGFSATARYAFTPRLSGAVRIGGMTFNTVSIREYIPAVGYGYSGPVGYVLYNGKWDHDVSRLEIAAGYKLDQSLLFKVGYQFNKTYGMQHDPFDNVLFLQTVLSF
ncbi:MAG TPA: hypothetical protein VI758_04515 [Bacteroidota bacterium]